MEGINVLSIIFIMTTKIQSYPVDNSFSVRYRPFTPKQGSKSNLGVMFSKMRHETKIFDLESENQMVKNLFLQESYSGNQDKKELAMLDRKSRKPNIFGWSKENFVNFINLPVISQPYDDYKILVATAPSRVNLGAASDRKKMVIYIVFPDNGDRDSSIDDIPRIYFVNENIITRHVPKNVDPIIIIDNNRTVTGLKSKGVPKSLQFRNKLTDPYYYKIVPDSTQKNK